MRWLLLCYIWKKREIKKEKAKKAWNQHAILPTSSFGVNDDVRDEYNNVLQNTRPLFSNLCVCVSMLLGFLQIFTFDLVCGGRA
jgi:hypothetical protein